MEIVVRVMIEPHDDEGHVPTPEEAAGQIHDQLVNDKDYERGWAVKGVTLT